MDRQEIGYASSVNDYLISVNGLPNARINEIVTTAGRSRGIITTLRDEEVDVLMLDSNPIRPREAFIRTYKAFSIKAGDYLLGRAIDPLGTPIDGKARLPQNGVDLPVD